MLDPVLQHLEADTDAAVARLIDFLRIPSVSTDPAYTASVADAAQWVAGQLTTLDLDTKIMPTAGHPVVVAKTADDDVLFPHAPRVLFYGHYDVQPPDPLELWDSPPFEPQIRHAPGITPGSAPGSAPGSGPGSGPRNSPHIYARGALDDKGQVATFFEACRAFKTAHGKLPVPLTFLIEGEEEMGSQNLPPFLKEHRDLLAADLALVCDTGMWQPTPQSPPAVAITYAMRGLVYFDLKLAGPSRDLHSGMYGGTLANPATELTRVLGKLLDDDRRVTIPGFYDDVADVTDTERAQWDSLGFNEADFLNDVGAVPCGETGHSTLTRRWARPSCDIHGLDGGYQGEGAKTVIPTVAGAKVSFRLPANMDPQKVARQFTDWIHSHDVGGCRWELTDHGQAWPVSVPLDWPFMAAARDAIQRATGRPAALIREGASIPIVADFKTILGLDTLLIGFGLESDNIHSPNERFGLDRFALGARTHAHLLNQLAATK